MTRAVVEPEQLSVFASNVNQKIEMLQNIIQDLYNGSTDLGDSWSDQGYEEFNVSLGQDMEALRKVCTELMNKATYLKNKEALANEYLSW
ncbi:MAG: WXG100 family type VII secretion target [Solirubrobacterales bacterium]